MELIGHPFRGFSLELLINIYLKESLTNKVPMRNLNDISTDLIDDRIRIMERLNLIYFDGKEISLTLLGELIGKIGINFKKVLNMKN